VLFRSLAFPVTGARAVEKQAVARNVDAFTDFFKWFGATHRLHVHLRGNFRAFAAAAIHSICGGILLLRLGLCGG
jgi:hypothetical protein